MCWKDIMQIPSGTKLACLACVLLKVALNQGLQAAMQRGC